MLKELKENVKWLVLLPFLVAAAIILWPVGIIWALLHVGEDVEN